jgi:hypothetical protein
LVEGALELVQKFGTVENLLSHTDQIEKEYAKIRNKQQLILVSD